MHFSTHSRVKEANCKSFPFYLNADCLSFLVLDGLWQALDFWVRIVRNPVDCCSALRPGVLWLKIEQFSYVVHHKTEIEADLVAKGDAKISEVRCTALHEVVPTPLAKLTKNSSSVNVGYDFTPFTVVLPVNSN